jgi:hypothetical protein
MRLNGIRLNGIRLNGIRLNGVRLNGIRLNGSALTGYVVVGYDKSGQEKRKDYSGADLVNAELVGLLEDGTEVPLRIDSYRAQRDISYYRVAVWDAGERAWQAGCGVDARGRGIEAIPVAGVWDLGEGTPTGGAHIDDPDLFTFGCIDTAIGECVEWGYKPWLTVTRCDGDGCWQVPGSDYHQACTRLVRADYCGDGRSWTQDGTPINVYDDVGIEAPDTSRPWRHEGNWGPDGASCLSATRVPEARRPGCVTQLLHHECSQSWTAETLVMTDVLAP